MKYYEVHLGDEKLSQLIPVRFSSSWGRLEGEPDEGVYIDKGMMNMCLWNDEYVPIGIMYLI